MAEQNMGLAYATLQYCNKQLQELANVCIYFEAEHTS
jgi:hypothetical protein